ncbi:MAG: hypothetical protein JW932_02250, partial [Deltaproteobacteria bacterium]|nr:hypothetical protein [Deltaproteobacteria bacterium]
KTFYIDFYGTLSEKDFFHIFFKSFSRVETKIENPGGILKSLFVGVKPKITFDPETGQMDITPSYDPEDRPLVFNEALDALAKYVDDTVRQVESQILILRHNEYANPWDNLSLNQKKPAS